MVDSHIPTRANLTLSSSKCSGALAWVVPASLLVAWAVGTTLLSWRFAMGAPELEQPIVLFVTLQVSAGIVWLFLVRSLRRVHYRRHHTLVIVGIGIVMRLAFFMSTPILEDDHHRYVWDGAAVSHGLNPYELAPAAVHDSTHDSSHAWLALRQEGAATHERINHPHLRTVYPPVAQGAFALAYSLAPWSDTGLRLVWLLLDTMTATLLWLLLREQVNPTWKLAIYWLNPLLVLEVYNSMHMEPVLLAFATGAIVLVARSRHKGACASLALAVGAKLWPALWLPLILRMKCVRRSTQVIGASIAALLSLLAVAPMVHGLSQSSSGVSAYASGWEMNDSLFIGIQAICTLVAPNHAGLAARGIVALFMLALVLYLAKQPVRSSIDLAARALTVTAALFLLSPTQFPWYALWMLPPLALSPRPSLLVLTITMPIYYLRFRFVDWGIPEWFDYGVVWIQYVPVWVLLVFETQQQLRRPKEVQDVGFLTRGRHHSRAQ